MKLFILIVSLCFSVATWGDEITDFNPPLWDFGTGTGEDAAGSGTLAGVPFTMSFSLNNGTKLFTSTSQHTSNSTLGHGGPPGSLILGGTDEGLTINFAKPVTVTLGLSHVNIDTDGWDFLTPADEVVSIHPDHEVLGPSINGLRQNSALGAITTDHTNISYFRWNDVTTINLQTFGAASTTIGLSSMSIPDSVPSLTVLGLFLLISMLGFVSVRKTKLI